MVNMVTGEWGQPRRRRHWGFMAWRGLHGTPLRRCVRAALMIGGVMSYGVHEIGKHSIGKHRHRYLWLYL